jgi:hypothetical protein
MQYRYSTDWGTLHRFVQRAEAERFVAERESPLPDHGVEDYPGVVAKSPTRVKSPPRSCASAAISASSPVEEGVPCLHAAQRERRALYGKLTASPYFHNEHAR